MGLPKLYSQRGSHGGPQRCLRTVYARGYHPRHGSGRDGECSEPADHRRTLRRRRRAAVYTRPAVLLDRRADELGRLPHPAVDQRRLSEERGAHQRLAPGPLPQGRPHRDADCVRLGPQVGRAARPGHCRHGRHLDPLPAGLSHQDPRWQPLARDRAPHPGVAHDAGRGLARPGLGRLRPGTDAGHRRHPLRGRPCPGAVAVGSGPGNRHGEGSLDRGPQLRHDRLPLRDHPSPWFLHHTLVGKRKARGRIETGAVFEQKLRATNEVGAILFLRRVSVVLDQPTRDGDTENHLLTNLPAKDAPAEVVANLYRRRWTIETAFQELEATLDGEITTLGYPKAALFAFCVALVSYNVLSTVKAALRAAHGADEITEAFSGYYLADEVRMSYRGMMRALPKDEWVEFQEMSPEELAEVMVSWARTVPLSEYRKSPRGPKKPKPAKTSGAKLKHVATAKILRRSAGLTLPATPPASVC